MRTKLGYVLTFLGTFLLVTAVLAQAYAPGALKKTPINADTVTDLAGRAVLNGPTGFESFPVLAYSTTKADSAKSDGSVVVFENSGCVVKDEGTIDGCVSNDDSQKRLITASTDTFAANRKSAMAINSSKYLPPAATPHEGLLNKWPFNAQRKTYPYWDGTVGKAVPATFLREGQLLGHTIYVYRVDTQKAPIQIAKGVPGFYSDQEDISIEPRTGAIVDVERTTTRTTEDGSPVLYLKIAYTPDEIKDSLDNAVSKGDQLHLVTSTVPIIGYIAGALALLAGLALVLLARGRGNYGTRVRSSDLKS